MELRHGVILCKMKWFLLSIFYFLLILFTSAKNETYKMWPSDSTTYIIPAFSSQTAQFEDFNETLNFVFSDNTFYSQSKFCLYISSNEQVCNYFQLQEDVILERAWNQSLTPFEINVLLTANWIISLKSPDSELWKHRINVILITDIYDFTDFTPGNEYSELENVFYYAIISVNKDCIQPNATQGVHIECYNIYKDTPSDAINDGMFESIIYYTFDPTTIPYSYFLVINESEINTMAFLPQYLQMNVENSYSGPTLFVASIQYETNFFEGAKSSKLSTNLIEKYMAEIYEADTMETGADQWSIVITDRFPHWITDTNLTFNSFAKHLDIYFCANNDTDAMDQFIENLSIHIDDILVNDDNATERLNHITMFNSFDDLNFGHSYFPTGKNQMPAKNFNFHTHHTQSTKSWTWIVISVGVAVLILMIILIAFLIWKQKMHRRLAKKYFWAVQAGYTSKEAEEIVENGKELFIDENFVEINYKTIQGKGSSAIVYSGFLNTESPVATMKPSIETRGFRNCKVAIKVVSKYGRDDYEQIFREVEAGIKLGWHRHICCLLGWSIKQSAPILIYEFIEGGDLYSWVKTKSNNNEEIEEKQITQILWQISDGMEYIASVGLVHKDLAARNIMITNSMVAKITDFGLASSCDESFTYQAPIQRRLPIRWLAPETMTDRVFSEASDVWSFGVLAWEIFSNCEIPYGNIDGNDILEYLNSGKRLEVPEYIRDEWKKLIEKCWRLDRTERPNFKEIKFALSKFLETLTESYGYITAITDTI